MNILYAVIIITIIGIVLVLHRYIPTLVTLYKYSAILKILNAKVLELQETSCYLANSVPDESKEYASIECCMHLIEEDLTRLKKAIRHNDIHEIEHRLIEIRKYLGISYSHIEVLKTETLSYRMRTLMFEGGVADGLGKTDANNDS